MSKPRTTATALEILDRLFGDDAELRLREVRAACELTQKQLAERLHIDQPNVSRLENRSCSRKGRCRSTSSGTGTSESPVVVIRDGARVGPTPALA